MSQNEGFFEDKVNLKYINCVIDARKRFVLEYE